MTVITSSLWGTKPSLRCYISKSRASPGRDINPSPDNLVARVQSKYAPCCTRTYYFVWGPAQTSRASFLAFKPVFHSQKAGGRRTAFVLVSSQWGVAVCAWSMHPSLLAGKFRTVTRYQAQIHRFSKDLWSHTKIVAAVVIFLTMQVTLCSFV